MMNKENQDKKSYVYKIMKSPIGELRLVGSERGLAAVLWENENPGRVPLNIIEENDEQPVLREAERQLAEYFAGNRKKFDLKLDFNGTGFQNRVWKALLNISFGQTTSYAQIARRIGNPKAARAVGAAMGRNPIAIVAACHRVIGSSGKLTGYAGGLKTKARLLELEGGRFDGEPHRNSRVMN